MEQSEICKTFFAPRKARQMNPIIEKVARAMHADFEHIIPWNECRKGAKQYDRELARAAIRATLEHLRDNVSEGMITSGEEICGIYVISKDAQGDLFKAMVRQALDELEA